MPPPREKTSEVLFPLTVLWVSVTGPWAKMPPPGAIDVPAAPAADPTALEKAANTLATANRVAIIADFAARPPHGWNHVVELAEALGASVWDVGSRPTFPARHLRPGPPAPGFGRGPLPRPAGVPKSSARISRRGLGAHAFSLKS